MSDPQIQMDLLSEDRDPLKTLIYAITRERVQKNQQRISNTHSLNPSGTGIKLIQRQRQQTQRKSILPTPPTTNKMPDCWKWGYKFTKRHLDNCPAKNVIGNICKKSRTLRQSVQIRHSTRKSRNTKNTKKQSRVTQQQKPTTKQHTPTNKHKTNAQYTSIP